MNLSRQHGDIAKLLNQARDKKLPDAEKKGSPRRKTEEGEQAAMGRLHAPDVRRSGAFIVHGGVSLTESLVPIITVKGGA